MTVGLYRFYGANHLHFITFSCYRRRRLLNSAPRRDLLLKILEETRLKYHFVLHGYVVMPEHVHLLITEPEVGDASVVMKVIKERFSRQLHGMTGNDDPVWQKRFYGFNVWSDKKRVEKLRYMHRNPVKRGLVTAPKDWEWSSFRAYWTGETGLVRVAVQEWGLEMKKTPIKQFGGGESFPLIRKKRE